LRIESPTVVRALDTVALHAAHRQLRAAVRALVPHQNRLAACITPKHQGPTQQRQRQRRFSQVIVPAQRVPQLHFQNLPLQQTAPAIPAPGRLAEGPLAADAARPSHLLSGRHRMTLVSMHALRDRLDAADQQFERLVLAG
jgi:hypothetical protein